MLCIWFTILSIKLKTLSAVHSQLNSIRPVCTAVVISHQTNAIYRGDFRGVSEVSRNHSGFSFDDGCALFQLQGFTRHTQRAEQQCYWLLFRVKVKEMQVAMKENWRPSQKFVLQCHQKLCVKIPPYALCKSPRQTGSCLETTQ